jgi:hypothetical protein
MRFSSLFLTFQMLTWTTWLPFTQSFHPQPTGKYLIDAVIAVVG